MAIQVGESWSLVGKTFAHLHFSAAFANLLSTVVLFNHCFFWYFLFWTFASLATFMGASVLLATTLPFFSYPSITHTITDSAETSNFAPARTSIKTSRKPCEANALELLDALNGTTLHNCGRLENSYTFRRHAAGWVHTDARTTCLEQRLRLHPLPF